MRPRKAPAHAAHAALACASLVLVQILSACGSPPGGVPDPTWSKDGVAAPATTIDSYQGEDHCGWEAADFLIVNFSEGETARRQYIRDPDGVVSPALQRQFVAVAELPPDARSTGYVNDDVELWLAPSDEAQLAYLVDPTKGAVEAWPVQSPLTGCD